ncbi:MAG: ArsR/SmtB family transcription factor [Vulcanimicrobiaceae bacterium]
MVNSTTKLDAVFSALADPTRRRILERLARRSLTVGEIAAGFSVSQPAISRHVRVLEESGLLNRRVVGRVHHCSLSPDAMGSASQWIEKQRRFWNAVLDRLETVLDDLPKERRKPYDSD